MIGDRTSLGPALRDLGATSHHNPFAAKWSLKEGTKKQEIQQRRSQVTVKNDDSATPALGNGAGGPPRGFSGLQVPLQEQVPISADHHHYSYTTHKLLPAAKKYRY